MSLTAYAGTFDPSCSLRVEKLHGVNVAEIAEQFEIPPDRVEAILAYAKSHRVAHPVKKVPVGVRRFLPKHEVTGVAPPALEMFMPRKLTQRLRAGLTCGVPTALGQKT